MSELIHTHDNRATIRWKLLTGASALALIAAGSVARAEDADHPLFWLELSAQPEMMQGSSSAFTAPFFTYPTAAYDAAVSTYTGLPALSGGPYIYGSKSFGQKQQLARFSFGGDAKLIFQPEGSDWLFSAEVRYGRSHTKRHTHYQGPQVGVYFTSSGVGATLPKYAAPLSDSLTKESERHTVLDFQAGKDVGLGLFGSNSTSTLSAGVRIAQFKMGSSTHISARPYAYHSKYGVHFHQYFLSGHQARSFTGIGPSLSWNASAVLAGNRDHGELTVDWGLDGAVLFGRQKAKTDHKTSAFYLKYNGYQALYPARAYNAPLRSKRVTVPELGGFIGLSAKLPHSKISIGYKGDIWFKAIDRGIDARKDSNLTFNGPYASISIGLGD
ncbi:MAG TPA: hypothetical protein VLW75_01870 [Rhizomicrobium sp.]|nr:hypothetical protein [Rhizomicrobium sp.]